MNNVLTKQSTTCCTNIRLLLFQKKMPCNRTMDALLTLLVQLTLFSEIWC